MTKRPKTLYTPSTGMIHVTYGDWKDSFHVTRLNGWIRFYERLANGKNGRFYKPMLIALKDVRDRI